MLGIDRRDRKWKRMVGTKAEERSLHFGREALDVVRPTEEVLLQNPKRKRAHAGWVGRDHKTREISYLCRVTWSCLSTTPDISRRECR